jgi:hypothetical protein
MLEAPSMQPDVIHLILCDEIQIDTNNFHRCNVIGLMTSIRSTAGPAFPVVRPQFVALVVWTGGQGTGELLLRIIEDSTGNAVFRTRPRQVRFVGDAATVGGVVFRMQNCAFPAAGLYWVEVLFAGSVIARQRLFLRA